MSMLHHINAGHLIDGSGGQIQKNILLTVKDGLVSNIEPFAENLSLNPADVTDLSLCTVLPPLVDCHAHLSLSGCTDKQVREQKLTADYQTIRPRILEHIHDHFRHGVLAVRDGGDAKGHTLRFSKEPGTKKKDPVIIKAWGRAWHQMGRYGSFIGRHPGKNTHLAAALAGDLATADHLKIINSGLNSLKEFGKHTSPQFSLQELRMFSSHAKDRGLKIMVHANGELPVQLALKAGCDSIEHGFFMGKDNLKQMAQTGTVWIPTIYTMKTFAETVDLPEKEGDREVVKKTLEQQLGQIALAKEHGVTIALGTDSGTRGVRHGKSAVEELKLIMKAGYSLSEAIQCATSHGAQLLGIDEIGLIAKSRPANFLVIRATPAMVTKKLSCPEAIYVNGKPCEKEFFNTFSTD